MTSAPSYQDDLAWVHHVGYGQLAERAAPGSLALLEAAGLMTERFATGRERSSHSPGRLDRRITVFRRVGEVWRRQDEHHRNVTCEPAEALAILSASGLSAEERTSFGDEPTLAGLAVLVGVRR